MKRKELINLIENITKKIQEETTHFLDNKKLPDIESDFFTIVATTLQHKKTDTGKEYYDMHPVIKFYTNEIYNILNIKTKDNIGAENHYTNFLQELNKLFIKYKKLSDKLNKIK